MKPKALKIIPLVLALVILAAMLGIASPVNAATNPVWAWGRNAYGELGYPLTLFTTEPLQVSGLTKVTAIVAGYTHGMALKSEGHRLGLGRQHLWSVEQCGCTK